MNQTLKRGLVAGTAVLALGTSQAAMALIVHGDPTGQSTNPSTYTQAPGDDPGWDYVSQFGAGGAVLIEGNWVLTVRHFSLGSTVEFGGQTFNRVPGTTVNLSNPGGVGTPDLRLFEIDGTPNLAPLQISQGSPLLTDDVVLIGHGRDRGSGLESIGIPPNDGYWWDSARIQAWGESGVSNLTTLESIGNWDTQAFRTVFEQVEGSAQAADNDSGGGVFIDNDGQWELAGMMIAAQFYQQGEDGPRASLFGHETVIADLSIYRDEIMAIVPEPGSAGLLGAAALLMLGRRGRRVV